MLRDFLLFLRRPERCFGAEFLRESGVEEELMQIA